MSQAAKRHKPDPPPTAALASTPDPAKLGPFYKILRQDLTHHEFTYQPGLNVDTQPFQPDARCSGGLYFSNLEHIAEYLHYGDLVARVTVPPEACWIQEAPGKFKADRIILNDIQPRKDWDLWNDTAFVERAVAVLGLYLKYVKNQTPELCLAAVQQNGDALSYVKDQSPEICLAAVQQNGLALEYVKHQTPELCLAAVQQNGLALEYVKDQSPEICLAAVQQNGLAVQEYVKHQTPELCLAAVQQNGLALVYVKHQTPELCLVAVQQNGLALEHVNFQTSKLCSAAVQQNGWALRFVKVGQQLTVT